MPVQSIRFERLDERVDQPQVRDALASINGLLLPAVDALRRGRERLADPVAGPCRETRRAAGLAPATVATPARSGTRTFSDK